MRVGFLGTSGAITSAARDNTSLVVAAETAVLVDCSGNPAQRLARLGWDWTALEHVVLTHRHADHVAGLPSLVHQLRLAHGAAPRPPLHVWGPPCALAVAHRLLEAVGLIRDDMFELSFHSLPAETTVQGLGDIQLETFAVAHGGVPTLGLQLTGESGTGSSVVYSSDTEPCDAVWRRSHSARLLVHECSSVTEPSCAGHTALAELEAQLPSDGSVEVRLVHLPPMDEALAAAVTARLAARFGGRVRLASDGELWERDAP